MPVTPSLGVGVAEPFIHQYPASQSPVDDEERLLTH